MKKILSCLIVGLILLECAFGLSACSSLTQEEKDYLEAAKIFDADYRDMTVAEYDQLYEDKFADKVGGGEVQGNYLSYIYVSGGEMIDLAFTDLESFAYKKDDALIYARILSSGKSYISPNSNEQCGNYNSDCKLFFKDDIIYQDISVKGYEIYGTFPIRYGAEKMIEEKNYCERDDVRGVSELINNKVTLKKFKDKDYEDLDTVKVFQDENYIKLELKAKKQTQEYIYFEYDESQGQIIPKKETYNLFYCVNYVSDKNGNLIAYRESRTSDTKLEVVFSLVPFEKKTVYSETLDNYTAGRVSFNYWDD